MVDTGKLICWDSEDIFAITVRLKTPGGQFHADAVVAFWSFPSWGLISRCE